MAQAQLWIFLPKCRLRVKGKSSVLFQLHFTRATGELWHPESFSTLVPGWGLWRLAEQGRHLVGDSHAKERQVMSGERQRCPEAVQEIGVLCLGDTIWGHSQVVAGDYVDRWTRMWCPVTLFVLPAMYPRAGSSTTASALLG